MQPIRTLVYGAAIVGLLLAGAARADRDRYTLNNEIWNAECSGCHVAYPPQLLPAASWEAVFAGLDNHFGSDASLDAVTAAGLLAYAKANAGRSVSGAPPLRITESPWFRREHDDIRAATWKKPNVGSPANCSACHTGAERGDYDEDLIRIPR